MAIGIVKGLNVAADAPPVGFVWKSASPISPAAIFAGTTWSQLKDRAIIAAGGGYANGSTGVGQASHLQPKKCPRTITAAVPLPPVLIHIPPESV